MSVPINKSLLKGRIVLAGVGNVLRGDDGFGLALAERIDGRVSFKVLDAGMAPENYLGVIIREEPDTILFADTAAFGGAAGDMKFLSIRELSDSSFTLTHNTSMKLLREFIAAEWVDAEVFIICVQPETMRLGEGLSAVVSRRVDELTEWFIKHFPYNSFQETNLKRIK